MSTPAPNALTPEQQELLSAYLDGETNATETAAVELLLKQPEAREYLDTLAATRELVVKHAPVHAPVGLSGRVMSALELKTAPKAGTLTAMPRMSWAAPLWAAAAVVVVSLGIMFGPSLFNTSTAPEQDIARQALENLAPPEMSDSMRPSGGGPGSDPFTRKGDEVMRDKAEADEWGTALGGRVHVESEPPAPEAASNDPAKRPGANVKPEGTDPRDSENTLRRVARGSAQGEAEAERAADRRNLDEPGDDIKEAPKQGKTTDDRLEEKLDGRRNDTNDGRARTGRAAGSAAGGGSAGDEQGRKQAAPDAERAEEKPQSEADGEGAPPPPAVDAAPAEAPGAQQHGADEVKLTVTKGGSLAAQVDFLWVSSLYGSAVLDSAEVADADVEDIVVTLDPRRLADLLAALRKLADDQGYGSVDGAKGVNRSADVDNADTHAEDGRPVSGYLPPRNWADAPDAATGRPTPVKVRITLK